jgi:hydroxyacylglutathione hydrolase
VRDRLLRSLVRGDIPAYTDFTVRWETTDHTDGTDEHRKDSTLVDTSKLSSWCHFRVQTYPSANWVLLTGRHPVLVDSGYGSDSQALLGELNAANMAPVTLSLVVNTHWRSDHVGGNYVLQHQYGVPIAAARADASAINARDRQACLARWLDQPVEPYHVDQPLDPGDRLLGGEAEWQVIATPGHTRTHLSLFQPDEGLLIVGDALHDDDVGWINLVLDGPEALDDALRTVEAIATLQVRCALSGHGPLITDPPAACARAHERYTKMRRDPTRAAWHALKRIFAFALMIHDGLALDQVDSYLVQSAWLTDHAKSVFQTAPSILAKDLLTEMRRIGAVMERDGRLYPTTSYRRPVPGWRREAGYPEAWTWWGNGAAHPEHGRL